MTGIFVFKLPPGGEWTVNEVMIVKFVAAELLARRSTVIRLVFRGLPVSLLLITEKFIVELLFVTEAAIVKLFVTAKLKLVLFSTLVTAEDVAPAPTLLADTVVMVVVLEEMRGIVVEKLIVMGFVVAELAAPGLLVINDFIARSTVNELVASKSRVMEFVATIAK
jgi:hypothetical protein